MRPGEVFNITLSKHSSGHKMWPVFKVLVCAENVFFGWENVCKSG